MKPTTLNAQLHSWVLDQIDKQETATALDIAKRLPCSVRDVAAALEWLREQGFLDVYAPTSALWPVYKRKGY